MLKSNSIILSITLLCLLHNIYAFCQTESSFGEGVAAITSYSAAGQYYKHIDTINTSNFKLKVVYFIKGNMILRKDNNPQEEVVSSSNQTVQGQVVQSYLTMNIWEPTRLIDLKRKKYYTFYTRNNKPHVSINTPDTQTFEFYYKNYNPDSIFHVTPKEEEETKPFQLSGLTCYQGKVLRENDTVYFAYTKERTGVRSPLNTFFVDFPYDIISFSGSSLGSEGKIDGETGTHTVSKKFRTLATVTVTLLQGRKLDDSIFEIPKGTKRKKDVPITEMIPKPSMP